MERLPNDSRVLNHQLTVQIIYYTPLSFELFKKRFGSSFRRLQDCKLAVEQDLKRQRLDSSLHVRHGGLLRDDLQERCSSTEGGDTTKCTSLVKWQLAGTRVLPAEQLCWFCCRES